MISDSANIFICDTRHEDIENSLFGWNITRAMLREIHSGGNERFAFVERQRIPLARCISELARRAWANPEQAQAAKVTLGAGYRGASVVHKVSVLIGKKVARVSVVSEMSEAKPGTV